MNARTVLFCLALWPLQATANPGPSFVDCTLTGPQGAGEVEAECARVRVPENRDRAGGPSIELLFARIPAVSRSPLPDPLVLLAGGPGQAASEVYPQVAAALSLLNRKRDIWLIDQRGTGGSSPMDCELPEESLFAAPDPAMQRRIATDCHDQLLAEGRDPSRYTTTDYIADLEQMRVAMGVEQINLYGGSYGTRVGLEYLRRHPGAIRGAVLDGVVPPELALGQDHAANLDRALALAFSHCREVPSCARRFGDPAAALTRLREVLRANPVSLPVRHPRTAAPETVELNHDVLAVVARLYAYAPETVALLPLLLDEALQGRGEALVAQAQMVAESLNDAIAMGLSMAVSCSEDAFRIHDDPADAPRLMGQAMTGALREQCAQWSTRPPPDEFTKPVRSDAPVLLLSGEWDPVTPPRYGEQVLAGLPNGRHLVAAGQGHIVLQRGCMPELVTDFVNNLDAASLEADCLSALGPPAFFIDHNGPTP